MVRSKLWFELLVKLLKGGLRQFLVLPNKVQFFTIMVSSTEINIPFLYYKEAQCKGFGTCNEKFIPCIWTEFRGGHQDGGRHIQVPYITEFWLWITLRVLLHLKSEKDGFGIKKKKKKKFPNRFPNVGWHSKSIFSGLSCSLHCVFQSLKFIDAYFHDINGSSVTVKYWSEPDIEKVTKQHGLQMQMKFNVIQT